MKTKIITLRSLIPAFGMVEYVAFTLKEDFENRHDNPDYDPIVMYVGYEKVFPDYRFGRAHEAETLVPMSLWEITDNEREEYMKWFEESFTLFQLDLMLSSYLELLDWEEDHVGESLPDKFTMRNLIPICGITGAEPISDEYIDLHIEPEMSNQSDWISSQLVNMMKTEQQSTFVICLRSTIQCYAYTMLELAKEKSNKSFSTFSKTALRIANSPFYFRFLGLTSLDLIEKKIRQVFEKRLYKRIYIEDATRINLDGDVDTDKYLTIIQTLRSLAKELECKIYITSTDIDLCC